MKYSKQFIWSLFIVYTVILIAGICLRDYGLFGVEVLYTMIMQKMVQTGVYAVPYIYDELIYTHKPPLLFWLGSMTAKLFFQGEINEFVVRLPSALSALLTLLVVHFLGKKMFSNKAGYAAMAVLGTTPLYLKYAAESRFDMLITFFILAALACFWINYACSESFPKSKKLFIWVLFYCSLSLGILAKGLIGFVLPCSIIFFFLLWEKKLNFLLKMQIPLGLLILLLVDGSWILTAYREAGIKYLYDTFFIQHFVRYLNYGEHQRWMMPSKPFYYFIYKFPVIILPWTVFIPFLLKNLWVSRSDGPVSARRFLAAWFGFIFLFFTFSDGKSLRYMLPLFPAVALFFGEYFAAVWGNFKLKKSFKVVFTGAFCYLAILLLIWAPFNNGKNSYKVHLPFFEQIKDLMDREGHIKSYKGDGPMAHYYLKDFHAPPDLKTPFQAASFLKKDNKNLILFRHKFYEELTHNIKLDILITNRRNEIVKNDDFYVARLQEE